MKTTVKTNVNLLVSALRQFSFQVADTKTAEVAKDIDAARRLKPKPSIKEANQ